MADVPTLRRPEFFDGQSLTAADLSAAQDYHRELLWLHQRTLHGSGIATGLAVAGAKGDKSVTVASGYAIDGAGQSIVLDAARTLAIPAVVSSPSGGPLTYYLTASYVADADLDAADRAGTCGSSGAVRRDEAPLLAWRAPGDVVAGRDVVLGAISVQNCKLAAPVDLSVRHSALPDRQPFIFAGQSTSTTTKWALWRPPDDPKQDPVGLRASVNTSEAGFANTPRYQAMVIGSRTFVRDVGDRVPYVVDGFVQVSSPSADGFDVLMTLPPGDDRVNPAWALTAAEMIKLPTRNRWFVSWLGVEG